MTDTKLLLASECNMFHKGFFLNSIILKNDVLRKHEWKYLSDEGYQIDKYALYIQQTWLKMSKS